MAEMWAFNREARLASGEEVVFAVDLYDELPLTPEGVDRGTARWVDMYLNSQPPDRRPHLARWDGWTCIVTLRDGGWVLARRLRVMQLIALHEPRYHASAVSATDGTRTVLLADNDSTRRPVAIVDYEPVCAGQPVNVRNGLRSTGGREVINGPLYVMRTWSRLVYYSDGTIDMAEGSAVPSLDFTESR